MGWTEVDEPFYPSSYDWRVPENEEQHMSETQNPGALLLKPKNVTLEPIEIQVPAERKWDISDEPDDGWYILGEIL